MAKARQKKDEPRTQIVVAMIAAAGVIVAGVIGAIGSVVSKSNGDGREETAITSVTASSDSPSTADPVRTMVYVTSVSTTRSDSLSGPSNRDYVTWKFAGTVKPSPGGQGAVFVLGSAQDGSQDVNSDPVSIAIDGSWVVVVGPIQRDLALKMTWTATYGIAAPGSGETEAEADGGQNRGHPEPVPSDRAPGEPEPVPSDRAPSEPEPVPSDRAPSEPVPSESLIPVAKSTPVPKKMLPTDSP
jgi:hypothetical protein